MLGKENAPSPFVTAEVTTLVAFCRAVTSAPGRTAPLLSTTTPEIVEVAPPWAAADAARVNVRSKLVTATENRRDTREASFKGGRVPVIRAAEMGTNRRSGGTNGYQAGA